MTTAVVSCVGCSFTASSNPDAPVVDAPRNPPDAAPDGPTDDGGTPLTCYGPSGAWQVCLEAAPTTPVLLPQMLDTDRSTLCLPTQPIGWTQAQPASCFVVGSTVSLTISVATTVTGTRPLVLVGDSQISIATVLDVANHQRDDNRVVLSPPGVCEPFRAPPGNAGGVAGAGGGAGGSFLTAGGDGGQGGALNDSQGGRAALADRELPNRLRGGCPGQAGGSRAIDDEGIGRGGGAIYLVSRGDIIIAGAVNASGAGGSGGGTRTGGSGGGSGGMIVLAGRTVAVPGTLVANGGGGAGGGDARTRGADGHDPSVLNPQLGAPGGGNGGQGFATSGDARGGTAGMNVDDGGGGGGGGAGFIRSTVDLGSAKTSPQAHIIP